MKTKTQIVLRNLFTFAIAFLVMYLGFMIITLEINFSKWNIIERCGLSLSFLACFGFTLLAINSDLERLETKK